MNAKEITGPEHLSELLGWPRAADGPNGAILCWSSVRIPDIPSGTEYSMWTQPQRHQIILQSKESVFMTDPDIAYMDRRAINNLKEYNATTPSRLYTGKMWKSTRQNLMKEGKDTFLCWYEVDKKTGNFRIVVVPIIPLEVIALLHE